MEAELPKLDGEGRHAAGRTSAKHIVTLDARSLEQAGKGLKCAGHPPARNTCQLRNPNVQQVREPMPVGACPGCRPTSPPTRLQCVGPWQQVSSTNHVQIFSFQSPSVNSAEMSAGEPSCLIAGLAMASTPCQHRGPLLQTCRQRCTRSCISFSLSA